MGEFYNRIIELEALNQHWQSDAAEFALLYGRRRLGKTYLLQKFLSEGRPHCYFLAAQTSVTANLLELAQTMIRTSPESGYTVADLSTIGNILRFAGSLAREHRFALILDEFQYLLEQDPSIPSQIQAWWDTEGIRSKIFLVLCCSHLGMMEGLGGPQAPLFGRFTFRYKLPPMTYRDIALFYADSNYSTRDKLMAFGILGGTPRYHALFDSRKSIGANIDQHILSPIGLLRHEPEVLMLSSQVRDAAPYNAVLGALANGCTKPNEIKQVVGATSAQLTFYLRNLMELEWITREYPFDEISDRRAIYRINDHFIRFWYRFVDRLRSVLEFQDYRDVYTASVQPRLNDYMGLHPFEDICHQFLKAKGADVFGQVIRRASRYWSRDGSLEIDMIAELADGSYLFGECKWSSSEVGVPVYYSLRDKVARMPEKYRNSVRYILFSAAGFEESLRATARRDGVVLVDAEDMLA
ncbi:MAG: ATP-binding protein [Armatimonadetes bacterium]|nr:ATP-binding protein [Armatimonadota bacterium]